MRLFQGLETVPAPLSASTVAIGTFDGIHLGHQAIIGAAVTDSRVHGRDSLVFTFDRHPATLLAPDRAPACLTTPAQRDRLVRALGVDGLVVAVFDRELANLAPETFVEKILKETLGATTIVVGANFAFGKNRSGDVAFLDRAQAQFDYRLVALDPVIVDGSPASSTRVRELLRAGCVAAAEAVLGHPYWLAGHVVSGQRLGRELGYPTANLELECRQVVPADGIYAVQVRIDGARLVHGACSIGERPTIAGAGRSIETFLLDFNEDLYGREMEIRFVERLRGEEKFGSLAELKQQMAIDVKQAREALSAAAPPQEDRG